MSRIKPTWVQIKAKLVGFLGTFNMHHTFLNAFCNILSLFETKIYTVLSPAPKKVVRHGPRSHVTCDLWEVSERLADDQWFVYMIMYWFHELDHSLISLILRQHSSMCQIGVYSGRLW